MKYAIAYTLSLVFVLICVYFPRMRIKSEANSLRKSIAEERRIIHDSFFRNGRNSGFLFLTENTLEFYYKKSKKCKNFYILLKDISSVSVSGNLVLGRKLEIKTIDAETSVTVEKPDVWRDFIMEAVDRIFVLT